MLRQDGVALHGALLVVVAVVMLLMVPSDFMEQVSAAVQADPIESAVNFLSDEPAPEPDAN